VNGSPLNYKFGGKELQETGMYDFGARNYMPDVGRWFNSDPMAELSPDLSPYRYAFNNPISFTDPDGMYEDYDDYDRDDDGPGKRRRTK
jgi:RHS repeat-associated protein